MKKFFTLGSLLLAACLGSSASVNDWGKLKLVGNQLCSESGKPVQLRGWSTHGSWFRHCYNDESAFQKMKQNGANMARLAMYITEGDGVQMDWIKRCVDYTANQDMYCIVDWHVLNPGNPNAGGYSGFENFFREVTQYVVQKGYKHVIYEVCNEPNEDTDGDPHRPEVWGWIKKYCDKVLPIIAQNDPGALVLVGTPQWDQAVSLPIEDPLKGDYMSKLNIMYSFHYYAGDQERYLGLLNSASAYIPLFVSEWGLSSHTGDSGVATESGNKLMKVCDGKNLGGQIISWANWSWADKGESSGTFTGGGYSSMSFSDAGRWMQNELKKGDNYEYTSSTPYEVQEFDGENDFYLALEKYDKGGNYEGYYDFDEDWACSNGLCCAGDWGKDGNRDGEYVDVGYCDKNDKENSYKNLGYIGMGEWVKYTIDVKHAGDYEFETYTTNHIDMNVMGITVDGENAIVDQNGSEEYRTFELQTSGSGDKDGGYNDWGWTTPKSPYAPEGTKFNIRFKEPGQHTIGLVFFTSCSGLGSLKIKGKDRTDLATATADSKPSIWPNPSNDGSFNVTVSEPSNVKVYGIQGLVYAADIEGNAKVDLDLASGVYFVTISNTSDVVTTKLLVK